MRFLMRGLIVLVVLAAVASGQSMEVMVDALYVPSSYSSPTVNVAVRFKTGAYENVMSEWFAFISDEYPEWGPHGEPWLQPWYGSLPPLNLHPEMMCSVLPPPSGLVYMPWGNMMATGVAIPTPSVAGGCSFGYAAQGWAFSGYMDVATWPVPEFFLESIVGTWVYVVGYTDSAWGGLRFHGAWAQVRAQ